MSNDLSIPQRLNGAYGQRTVTIASNTPKYYGDKIGPTLTAESIAYNQGSHVLTSTQGGLNASSVVVGPGSGYSLHSDLNLSDAYQAVGQASPVDGDPIQALKDAARGSTLVHIKSGDGPEVAHVYGPGEQIPDVVAKFAAAIESHLRAG